MKSFVIKAISTVSFAVAGLAALGMASSAKAGFITQDLSSIANSSITTYTNGGNYPPAGMTTLAGIPFLFANDGSGSANVVGGLASLGTPANYIIPGLNIPNVTSMIAIINSAFGICGTDVGSIGAQSGGSSSTTTLTEGTNVRDHLNDGTFCGTQTEAIATVNFGDDAIYDIYEFDLAALTLGGANPITQFNFNTDGQGIGGEPFLAALTFVTNEVPEPGTLTLFVIALGGLVLMMRRRRKAA
ncbi:MAG: PEP-CTERM sorting domain-containing protein [Pseudomonadota bacterium]